jgi:septum site-determining protein MinC
MKSSVIIKGNKYGFQIVLNPTLPFEELLREVAAKFRESMGFFDSSRPVAIGFEGRDLTPGQQNILVDTIMENSNLSISYIINGAEAVETQYAQALREAQGKISESQGEAAPASEEEPDHTDHSNDIITESIPEALVGKDGQFYRGTLRSGQKIEVDGSLVVLGDINPGAQIVAGGNIVVLGCLKGSAYAGYPNNKSTFVAALWMEPMQIQIGSCIARSPDHKEKPRKAVKKKNAKQMEARMAFVENDNIFIETITRTLINEISIQ